jgi:hypothetical protein
MAHGSPQLWPSSTSESEVQSASGRAP